VHILVDINVLVRSVEKAHPLMRISREALRHLHRKGHDIAAAPAARLYLTTAAGAQVMAFDIPSPARGTFAANPIAFTLPSNSPFVGQKIGVLIFVSAPSLFAANFAITPIVGMAD
jgi:hypothetical protein